MNTKPSARRSGPGPYHWPRPGHEACSTCHGYGPMAHLAIRVHGLEERLATLEEELAEAALGEDVAASVLANAIDHWLCVRLQEARRGQ